MIYEGSELRLLADRVVDRFGEVLLRDLPDPRPTCPLRLAGATPILERLWRVALWDVESNIRETALGRFFAGGAKFRATVYTRDISYSGILGLNRLYPELMRSSIEVTRRALRACGFRVSRGYAVPAIKAPWEELDVSEIEFRDKFGSNNYCRRTDDVVWLWAAHDLLRGQNATRGDWEWLYQTGCEFFETFYRHFYDPEDGLYRGQASFIDVTFPDRPRPVGGYPSHYTLEDCLMLKAASTNALYMKGMGVLSDAAARLGREEDAAGWEVRRQTLRGAIQRHLVGPDGRLRYYRDRHGALAERAEALGTALCALHDALDPEISARCVSLYPKSEIGVPVFDPFFENHDGAYHNNGSWPFVDTFFLSAAEKALGVSQCAFNLALLARTARTDGFHEVVDMRSGEVIGSGHQLWSAAAFINTCLRAGLKTNDT